MQLALMDKMFEVSFLALSTAHECC